MAWTATKAHYILYRAEASAHHSTDCLLYSASIIHEQPSAATNIASFIHIVSRHQI